MALEITLHTPPVVPLEAGVISPDRLAGLNASQIASLPVLHGNEPAAVGDFFRVRGSGADEIRLEGDLSRCKWIGHRMSVGRLVVTGPVGRHAGAEMRGGELEVLGAADDWAGAEMTGGRLIIHGQAGHNLGSAYRGSRAGMQGGEILLYGDAGDEAGQGMRRGLIAIGGRSGDFTGAYMLAGTIIVLGEMGWRAGAGMRRGSIISLCPVRLLPSFGFACIYRPTFLRLYLRYLNALGLAISTAQVEGRYQRWSGDCLDLGRGEILFWNGE